MLEKQKLRLLLFLVPILLVGCELIQGGEKSGCIPPPESFTEADLIGTWVTGLQDRNDTLILQEDGRYKQIVHVEKPRFDYESDWQQWWVEYSDNGIPYVHIEDMRMCVYWSGVECKQVGGGEHYWKDFCRDEWVQTPSEGVLIVMGTPKGFNEPPRGIRLFALGKSIEGGTAYRLQEP